jgi:hypothetical protein
MKLLTVKTENKAYTGNKQSIKLAAKKLYDIKLKLASFYKEPFNGEIGIAQMGKYDTDGCFLVSIIVQKINFELSLQVKKIHNNSLKVYNDLFPTQCGQLTDILIGYVDQYCENIENRFKF